MRFVRCGFDGCSIPRKLLFDASNYSELKKCFSVPPVKQTLEDICPIDIHHGSKID